MDPYQVNNMNDETFVQQRAYIYAYLPEEEWEFMSGEEELIIDGEVEECLRGVVIIDILGE